MGCVVALRTQRTGEHYDGQNRDAEAEELQNIFRHTFNLNEIWQRE